MHKEVVPEGKKVNAEFYKGVVSRLLKHIHQVRPDEFCSRDFFLLHDNAAAHKATSICQFLTPKMLQTFITPRTLQIYLRQTIFCSQVENEVKRTPLCGYYCDPSSRNR